MFFACVHSSGKSRRIPSRPQLKWQRKSSGETNRKTRQDTSQPAPPHPAAPVVPPTQHHHYHHQHHHRSFTSSAAALGSEGRYLSGTEQLQLRPASSAVKVELRSPSPSPPSLNSQSAIPVSSTPRQHLVHIPPDISSLPTASPVVGGAFLSTTPIPHSRGSAQTFATAAGSRKSSRKRRRNRYRWKRRSNSMSGSTPSTSVNHQPQPKHARGKGSSRNNQYRWKRQSTSAAVVAQPQVTPPFVQPCLKPSHVKGSSSRISKYRWKRRSSSSMSLSSATPTYSNCKGMMKNGKYKLKSK